MAQFVGAGDRAEGGDPATAGGVQSPMALIARDVVVLSVIFSCNVHHLAAQLFVQGLRQNRSIIGAVLVYHVLFGVCQALKRRECVDTWPRKDKLTLKIERAMNLISS